MALTPIEVHLWKELRDAGKVPDRPSVLQFGEVNIYNSPSIETMEEDFRKYADPDEVGDIIEGMRKALENKDAFAGARLYYQALLRPKDTVAVDQSGSLESMRQDLNEPLNLPFGAFDILINSGTAEHVFDQRQFWKSAHDHTRVGGLMFHALPLWGWLDHGLVNYHPTFVADMAATNEYGIEAWCYAEIGTGLVVPTQSLDDYQMAARRFGTRIDAMQFVVFRKRENNAFKVPIQGYYAGRLSKEQERVWNQK